MPTLLGMKEPRRSSRRGSSLRSLMGDTCYGAQTAYAWMDQTVAFAAAFAPVTVHVVDDG